MTERTKKIIIVLSALGVLLLILLGPVIWVVSQQKHRNATKLLEAITDQDLVEIQTILDAGVDPNQTDIPPSNFWSFFEISARRPLAEACSTGNYEIVRLLVEHGATAEYIKYTGWSPIRETVFYYDEDDVKLIKLLLANGADPDVEESGEHAVFAAAEMYPMPRGSEDFLTGYDKEVADNITQIVQMLLVNQKIDIQSPSGETVLMCAARRGNLVLVEYCIAQGCDVYLKNAKGQTAYDIAVEYGKQEVADLIRQGTVLLSPLANTQ